LLARCPCTADLINAEIHRGAAARPGLLPSCKHDGAAPALPSSRPVSVQMSPSAGFKPSENCPARQMHLVHQVCRCFALSGAPHYAPEISTKPALLRRTLRRVGGQFIAVAFVVLDIAALGFALAAPVWVAPWVIINATALMLGSLSWSEDRRIQRE